MKFLFVLAIALGSVNVLADATDLHSQLLAAPRLGPVLASIETTLKAENYFLGSAPTAPMGALPIGTEFVSKINFATHPHMPPCLPQHPCPRPMPQVVNIEVRSVVTAIFANTSQIDVKGISVNKQ